MQRNSKLAKLTTEESNHLIQPFSIAVALICADSNLQRLLSLTHTHTTTVFAVASLYCMTLANYSHQIRKATTRSENVDVVTGPEIADTVQEWCLIHQSETGQT